MPVATDHLVREQLTGDQRESSAAVAERHIKALNIAELAEHGLYITRYRLRPDANAASAERRGAKQHV